MLSISVLKILQIHQDPRIYPGYRILGFYAQTLTYDSKVCSGLLGRQSTLSLSNKLRVYSAVIKPIWTYGMQLWSSACKSNNMAEISY